MNEIITKTDIKDDLVNLFKTRNDEILSGSSSVVNSKREKGIRFFEKIGFPDKKSEDYKYTNIKKIFETTYKARFTPQTFDYDMHDVFRCDVPELDTHTILLINGWYPDAEEPLKELPGGIIVGSFSEASKQYPDIFKKHYASYAKPDSDSLTALNTAFAKDGLFVYVPKNKVMDKPLQIIKLLAEENEPLMVQPRNLIVLEENSQAKIIVCDHTLSAQRFLSNSVTEIAIEENALLDMVIMQNEHNGSSQVSSTFVNQKKGSNSTINTLTLHGGFIRNNIHVLMDGEHCETNLFGLYLADKAQHIDNYTYIDHAKSNCNSNELYKGIIDEMASAAFNGRVLVREDAQNTNATQSNNNILMTNDADVFTKPQLEIYADDVKCSHGATVGQLDQDALFYLKSRGINHKESMTLLMLAFVDEVISKINAKALKEKMSEMANKRLRGEFTRCNNCVIKCGEIL